MSVGPRRRLLLIAFSLLLSTASLFAAPDSRRYMIEFHDFNGAAAAVRAAGGEIVHEFPEMRVVAARLPEAAVRGLENSPKVKLIAPESPRVPMALWNDTTVNGETVPFGISMVQADRVAVGGAMPRVCIIDSGYRLTHVDLPKSPNVSGYNGTLPWNEDGDGHGTHVAGTIAAIGGNGTGVVGVVPSNANLYIVRVFGNDGKWAYESDLINAVQRCRDAGSKVISMSLGGGKPLGPWEQSAFDSAYNAGVLSIAAAGNAGDTSTSYPAGYASVMSVAAVDADEAVASFSQKNADVEIAAPGVNTLSTYPKLETNNFSVANGPSWTANHVEGSGRTTGTSAPIVDGGICDVAGAWTGKVVLCQRGTVSFKQKVDAVAAGGGVAAVLYNNATGNFFGTCDDGTGTTCNGVPAVSISMEDGAAALAYLSQTGTVVSKVEPSDTQYMYNNGTSMATPHVSAVAALVWSHNSGWTNAQVRNALTSSARDKGAAGRDNEYGYGIAQACAALKILNPSATCGGGSSEPPPPPPPTDVEAPVISSVTAAKVHKNGRFEISWSTNEASNSEVRFTSGATGTYSDAVMTTAHKMSFSGKSGTLYQYYVSSTDAAGNKSTAGPFTHQN